MKRFYLKIFLPSLLTIVLFILTIFFIVIPQFQENIMNGKREMIKELTNSAWSILSKYENDEKNGLLTREEAQKTAISRIQYLRYGDESKDYFWITDLYPKMIMHPYRTDLNGKDLTNFSDPHGKKMFVEFVDTVKKSEHGYVDYMWQWKDDSLHIVAKLSYVKIFKPWGWVIGTGIYIEDVKKEINALTKKLLWISIGISLLVAFMLLFISQQSLKIERKKIAAEKELHESKEKYRTLVEAATEGLIMLIDGKISFLNSVISKMTGFENKELINLHFSEMLSDNNTKDIIDIFLKKNVTEGKYEINIKKKNGGFIEVLVTASTTEFFGETVNIIIVKDITIDRNANLSIIDYQKLLNTMDIGFFRARIDVKGKFIFANETALKLLGYENFHELSKVYILELLVDSEDRKSLRNQLIENGFIKNKVLTIQKKNSINAIVSVTLVAFNNEDSKDLICDGIIEDITLQEEEKSKTNQLIASLKANSFLLEQPVKDFLKPIHTLDADSLISDAVKTLATKKTDNLIVTKDGNDVIGIITNSDIQKRVLTSNLNLGNPVYLIMSSPVSWITENTSVEEAIGICEAKGIHHLLVKNNTGDISGILNIADVSEMFKNSLSFFNSKVKKAETLEEIKLCYTELQKFLVPLIQSEVSMKYITAITSSLSDSIIKRLIDLSIVEIGEPPVSFSFICVGSEGRREETLFTDQDNAIIYEDVSKEKEVIVNAYFNKLGVRVCDALNYVGYAYCVGNIMAKNPQWCKPISEWEKYFAGWIFTPEPQNLLEATVFFDFRNIYGDDYFTERLQKTLGVMIKENPLFLYHLAYNTFSNKLPQISSGSIISDKTNDLIDLKSVGSFFIMFARTYCLQNNIWITNTSERLIALKELQIVSKSTVDEMLYSYNFIMKLRFRNQMELSQNGLQLSNSLKIKNLNEIELTILKKILSLMALYQNKIGIDFRIKT